MTKQSHNRNGRPMPHKNNRTETLLTKVLLVLLCATILAVLALGGMFIHRLSAGKDELPNVDTSPQATDSPDIQTPITTDSHNVTTAPADTAPATDTPATEEVPHTGGELTIFIPASADAGEDYLENFVFLGDSTTYHMHHYSDLEDKQVWVPAGGTLEFSDITNKSIALPVEGVHYADWTDVRISDALASAKPKVLVVTLGINFSAYYREEEHGWSDSKKEEYFKLQVKNVFDMVQRNSPETILIFQSIYPVIDKELINKGSPIRQAHVDERNKWLYEACEELGIPVLKTEEVLKDENGQLKSQFNSYHLDGIHLNPDAYKTILNYVRTHAISLSSIK